MKKATKIRFKNNGERLSDFRDKFLVICPNCKNCATVIPKFKEAKYNKYVYITIDSVALTCLTCGYSKRKENVDTCYLGDCDFYFQLPLWC